MITSENGPTGDASAPINALVLDDDDFDRRRLMRMGPAAGLNMNIVSVPSIEDMCLRLEERAFDLFFLDYRLASGTGLDALNHIQNHATNANAAKIMLTGHLKVDVAVTALKNGCHDYISKDTLTPTVLRETVESVLVKSRQQVSTMPSREEVLDQAIYNLATTHLPNILAKALTSGHVQQAIEPLLQSAIEDGLTKVLSRYELPTNVLTQPDIQSLIGALEEDQQIHLRS